MTTAPSPDSSDVVLVLTEAALTAADVEHLLDLYRDRDGDGVPDPLAFRVLVPADTERNVLVALLAHLGSGDLRQAWDDLRSGPSGAIEAEAKAADALRASLAAITATGVTATGAITGDDPLPALTTAVADGAREVVVVTYPHALADTFHADWASRARERLTVPVLHLYAGTSELG
ncbi:hypothetical protein [Xylanimonas ulmi]|uniref:Uncharacterized protein n=1 Tax=Xylanimonas ulmi TaxID=228973 RepID=A0A4Q7M013_9MICO|nr:hypothetical protein [Xylanibacterium ulmi]RZS61065.1 hypothetical protein EV386_1353 [Xylanibacterium ulmi]